MNTIIARNIKVVNDLKETKEKEYAFVIDSLGNKLSPTNVNKAWFLIRKNRALLIQKYPMAIQLINKEIPIEDVDNSKMVLGIDDGSKHVGIAIVQRTLQGRTKSILKGTLNQRLDVKEKMSIRRNHRKYRRSHKRYRPTRFLNRKASTRKGRIAPTIKQKKQAILRAVNNLNKQIRIDSIVLEDVLIDIRALQDEKKLYGKDYTISNRLDSNIRMSVLMRDKFTCQVTGNNNCKLEVHHITPKRLGGNNTLDNLITLSSEYHKSIAKKEMEYAEYLYSLNKGKDKTLKDASHVMQGKRYLREELSKIAELALTYGTETYNNRVIYGIEKTHSNDALVIAGVKNNTLTIKEWFIRPLRSKVKGINKALNSLRYRDLVTFESSRSNAKFTGWIISINKQGKLCSVTNIEGKTYRNYTLNNMKLLCRFKGIQWI